MWTTMMVVVGRRRRVYGICGAVALGLTSCSSPPAGSGAADELAAQPLDAAIAVSSPAFGDGDPVPQEFSCDGDDVAPPLSWQGVPNETVELAVVVDDPDAGRGTYVHWVLFGLDPSVTELERGVVPTGGRQARNSAGAAEYKGPCPPGGDPHHYRFSVYALGAHLDAGDGAGAGTVLTSIRDAAIARGTLVGTYER
jgi:Raf kinase inhibitor-like YbhB/YbcL family protein